MTARLPLFLLALLFMHHASSSTVKLDPVHCVPFNLPDPAQPPQQQADSSPLTQQQCSGCSYGSLPGMWDPQARMGEKWQALTHYCRLRNLVEKYRTDSCPQGPNPRPKVLMLVGDSVDRELLGAVADELGTPHHICNGAVGWDMNRVSAVQVNPQCGGPIMGRIHLYGSSLEGPWEHDVTENYEAILNARVPGMWRGQLGLPDPALVILNSNLWDIARAGLLSKLQLSSDFEQAVLPRDFVESWLDNSTQLVRFVQRLFPGAAVGWHTVVVGKHGKDGVMLSRQLGKKSFVAQLNAAGRALAAELGLLLVDYEALQARFHDFSYLRDAHHQSADLSLELANVYLNLLEQLPALPHDYFACQADGVAAGLGR